MTENQQTINLYVGSDILRSYKRLAYTPWHALAEFVDNSTQSFFDNADALKGPLETEGTKLEVRISYDRDAGFLRISDNAMGMSFDELAVAVRIGKPPANTSGRSQYGLGMKTAACWLGNEWMIKTKKLNEEFEHSVTINVERVAAGDLNLNYRQTPKSKSLHYTILEIKELNQKLQGRRLGKVKEFLRSMYRVDIRNGVMDLFWLDSPLTWTDEAEFLKSVDGAPYKKDFEFVVDGKTVRGWIGILGEGRSGRPNAGFSILRRGRVIKGYPEAWRPSTIFGQIQGTNDLINQRIAGEIHLDEFEVSHTKDDILFEGTQEDDVEQALRETASDYVKVAREHRTRDKRGPSEVEVQTAVDELRTEMESQEFVDLIEIETVPPEDVVTEAIQPVVTAAANEEPRFRAVVGDVICKVYLENDLSPNDPYFVTDLATEDIVVVVNTKHPHWSQLVGSEGVLNYLRHCVYDAIAEWQCSRKTSALLPNTIKVLKDRLLRLPAALEDAHGS